MRTRKIAVIFLASLTTACVIPTPPQTPEELRAGVRRGAAMTKMQAYDIDREFTRVLADVSKKGDKCLAVSVTRRVSQGYNISQTTSHYHPRAVTTAAGKAEFVLQVTYQPKPIGGPMPAGGYYVLVVDIVKVAPQKTKISIYGGSAGGWGDVLVAIKEWASGNSVSCPKLP